MCEFLIASFGLRRVRSSAGSGELPGNSPWDKDRGTRVEGREAGMGVGGMVFSVNFPDRKYPLDEMLCGPYLSCAACLAVTRSSSPTAASFVYPYMADVTPATFAASVYPIDWLDAASFSFLMWGAKVFGPTGEQQPSILLASCEGRTRIRLLRKSKFNLGNPGPICLSQRGGQSLRR